MKLPSWFRWASAIALIISAVLLMPLLFGGTSPSQISSGMSIPLRALLGANASDAPWVTIERTNLTLAHWEIVASWYVPPEEVGNGPANVYAVLVDYNNQPTLNYRGIQQNGGTIYLTPKLNDAGQAEVNFPMSSDSSFDPALGQVGPYKISVEGFPSDRALGMGLPLRRHVQNWFVFRLSPGGTPTSPTPGTTPGVTQTPSSIEQYILSRVARALRLAADDLLAPQ